MKQVKWLLLIAVGILAVLPGCDKFGAEVNVANTVDNKLVVPILAGKGTAVGDINMWNDGDSVYIHYIMYAQANPADQWYLKTCQADIELRPEDFPVTPPVNGKPGGDPIPSAFAHQSGDISYGTEYMFSIPVGSWTGSVYVATRSVVCQLPKGVPPERNVGDGWAGPFPFPGGRPATYFAYEFGEAVGGAQWHWGEAWAGTGVGQIPFPGNDWATYITHTIGTTTTEELYSDEFTQCGTITVTDDLVRGRGRVYVTYSTTNGWYMRLCQFDVATYEGGIPQVDGNPVPDQFRYQSRALYPYEDTYTFSVRVGWPEALQKVVVAAHADAGVYN